MSFFKKPKDIKCECVYAGPEMMETSEPTVPKPVEAPKIYDGVAVCPACGSQESFHVGYCSQCGMPLKPEQNTAVFRDLQTCMPTYAGPDFYNPQFPNGAPGAFLGAQPVYPQNYQQNDEEPLDVYAGPPIDDEE
jgi:hypothetical protein